MLYLIYGWYFVGFLYPGEWEVMVDCEIVTVLIGENSVKVWKKRKLIRRLEEMSSGVIL